MPKRLLRQKIEENRRIKLDKSIQNNEETAQLQSETCVELHAPPPKRRHTMSLDPVERLLTENSYYMNHIADHDTMPAFNAGLWPQQSLDHWLPYPSYNFSTPHPIYMAGKHCGILEVCYKRPMNYAAYRLRINHIKTAYQNAIKKKNIRAIQKENIYPMPVFNLAERLHQIPDPFFHGSYDYYYTGGNLCVLPQTDTVLHVGGDDLQELKASNFISGNGMTRIGDLENISSKVLENASEIFEIQSVRGSDSYATIPHRFITRQRTTVTLLAYNGECLHKMVNFKSQKSPLVSVAQSATNANELLISSMKQQIRQYDLNSKTPTLVKQYEVFSEHLWNTIKPWREHTYFFANEKLLSLIDTRTKPDQWLDNITINDGSKYSCEHISALTPSTFTNLLYVATNHHLHCMDVRYFKTTNLNNSELGICRWTHQSEFAPLLIDTLRIRNSRELVALSSPIAGDLSICELTRSRNLDKQEISLSHRIPKHIYKSKQLPYQPPTLQEAYDAARVRGKCLQPEANLQTRIRCCTSGLKFHNYRMDRHEDGTQSLLMFATSNGDIYAHTVAEGEVEATGCHRISRDTTEIMDAYAKKICDLEPPPLNYTEIVKFKVMRKILRCKQLNVDVLEQDVDDTRDCYSDTSATQAEQPQDPAKDAGKTRKKRYQHLGSWQKSFATLQSYKDALVQDLLSVWDLDVEDENHVTVEADPNNAVVKVESKVNNWLSNSEFDTSVVTSISANIAEKYNNITLNGFLPDINTTQRTCKTEDYLNSTQRMDCTLDNYCPALDDSALNTTLLSKIRPKSNPKKYVKGF